MSRGVALGAPSARGTLPSAPAPPWDGLRSRSRSCEAAGPAGSEPSVPPGWAPQAAAEISPRGPRAHLPYWSPARPALLSLTPAARPPVTHTCTARPPVTHTWCCRWAGHPAGQPAAASASQSIPPPPQQDGRRGAGRGGRGCRVTVGRGAGSQGCGVMGGGCIGSEG